MSKREMVAQEVDRLSDENLDRLLQFLQALADEHAEAAASALAAEPLLAKEWLSPDEDAAWANL